MKVLDFGLAKLSETGVVRTAGDPSLSPTLASPTMTGVGVILGTAAYMSPEQAAGKLADKRADIWSFGVVLWEMLTGERLFASGESTSHVLADVLRAPIDFERIPAGPLRELLRRCLDREVKTRLRDIGEARVVLSSPLTTPTAAPMPNRRATFAWAAVAAAVVVFVGVALWAPWRAEPDRSVMRFPVDLGADVTLPATTYSSGSVVLSPDATRLAYVASVAGGPTRLYVRRLDTPDDDPIVELSGTEGATGAAFSPDGQSLAFLAGTRVYRISPGKGAALRLSDTGVTNNQITWGDGDIILVSGIRSGLWRIPSAPGEAVRLTELKGNEIIHAHPHVMRDGKTVLFSVGSPGIDVMTIEAVSVDGGDRKVILRSGAAPSYILTGHLLYMLQNTLFAVRLDADTLQTTGDAVPIVADVRTTFSGLVAVGGYSIARNGTLVYRKASGLLDGPEQRASLIESIDASGRRSRLGAGPGRYVGPRFSPDASQIALTALGVSGPTVPVASIYDTRRESLTKLSVEGVNVSPVWRPPQGRHIVFLQLSGGGGEFRWIRANGGQPQRFLPGVFARAGFSFSGDGDRLAFASLVAGEGAIRVPQGPNRASIYTVAVTEEGGQLNAGVPELFSAPQSNEFNPEFSPDGRWIAFVSDRNQPGQNEVWVRTAPRTSAPGKKTPLPEVRISNNGGDNPRWSHTSRELLYRSGDQIMAVSFTVDGDMLVPQKPRVRVSKLGGATEWDLSRDGRILIVAPAEASKVSPAEHTVVFLQNFFDEVRRRVK